MNARLKKIMLLVLCAALTLSVFALPVKLSSSKQTAAESNTAEPVIATDELPSQQNKEYCAFLKKASDLYRKYDKDVDASDSDNPLALKRIMVNGFDGNTYGAAECAYDSENDFALLQYETEADAETALSAMLADGVLAEPDTIAVLDAAKCRFNNNDTYPYSRQLGLPSFFNRYQMASDDVIVAVLDTGVMYDHQYIADRFYSHGVDLSGDGKPDAYYDTEKKHSKYSHATFVAGIIADNTPDSVKIQPYKIVPFETGFANSSLIVEGINTAVMDGASVINISSHTNGGATSIARAVKNANNKGACVCASAGNGVKNENNESIGIECDGIYPACTPGVITVSATKGDGTAIADYSNYGSVIDFAAPGTNIRSTYAAEGGSSVSNWSGTSFSTPYIASMCANIKSLNKTATRAEVYNTLKHCADDYGDEGYDIYFGYGVPNFDEIRYEGEGYAYDLPQGTLTVTGSADYTAQTQPWRLYAAKMLNVTVDSAVTGVGDYSFYNMSAASFTLPETLQSVGDYAFYHCDSIQSFTFDENVGKIGYKAFGDIEGFTVSGYRNTPAETYAISEGIPFTVLGCKHNYIYEVFDPTEEAPEGYTEYTCTVCGNSYRGAYIPPAEIVSGSCGETLTYVLYDNGKLVIDGSGAMYDYFEQEAPWYAYRDQMQILEIRKDVSSIDPFAFYGCNRLSKIRCFTTNAAMYSDGTSLIDKQTNELILTVAKGTYTIPEEVTAIRAPAFITLGNTAIEPNSHFVLQDGILYDADGNIVCALPSYAGNRLVIDDNTISILQFAFMYTQYPKYLDTNVMNIRLEPFSAGYYYDGTLHQTNLAFKALAESTAYQYADENGFEVDGANIGKCGVSITWRYDETARSLSFTGSGDMFEYTSVEALPWSEYLPTLKTVIIGDEIHSVADYAFSGASQLTTLTMPLSLQAPLLPETWKGCTAIKTLRLTYGTGYMDDYTDEDDLNKYKYTPWYLSRRSITSFTLDSDVKYIGEQAFRNCLAIKSLTLNGVECIAEDAFINCSNLKSLTITAKQCAIADYSFFFLKSGSNYQVYPTAVLYAYDDSTAHDYAVKLNTQYVSLGCGHTRTSEVRENEIPATCTSTGSYDAVVYCNDCSTELSRAYKMVAKLPHTPVVDEGIPATCTATGLTEGSHCDVCCEILAAQEVIEALGHNEVTDEAVAPTCTATGLTEGTHCSRCGVVFTAQETVAKLGHSWDKGKVTKAATMTAAGVRTYTCTRCGGTKTETIAKTPKNGWLKENGKWYYYTDNVKAKGWKQLSGKWYLFDKSTGAMLTGWQKDGGKWYYFDTSGAMLTGWQKISNKWYYFNSGGAMLTGWQKLGGKWYYFNTGGDMVTGWKKIGSSWYYFNSGGDMRTANLTQNGKTYKFNASGVCTNP